jgi:hypothetical protein
LKKKHIKKESEINGGEIFARAGEEKEEKLTSKEKYIFNHTRLGRTLKFLRENPDFPAGRAKKQGMQKLLDPGIITMLENRRIIKIEKGRVKEINLEKFWKESIASKILNLVEEEKFITAGQIAKKLKDWSHKFILGEANNLVSAGLLKFKRMGRENMFFPSNFSNEKINMEVVEKKIKRGNEKIGAKEK